MTRTRNIKMDRDSATIKYKGTALSIPFPGLTIKAYLSATTKFYVVSYYAEH